jgi:hypothetical protein
VPKKKIRPYLKRKDHYKLHNFDTKIRS